MFYFLAATVVAFAVCWWIISAARDGATWGFDSRLAGPQKIHTSPVPRLGGVALYAALAASALMAWLSGSEPLKIMAALVLCGTPSFVFGLVEDFTAVVSPKMRLMGTAASGLLAFVVVDASIGRVDIPGIDWLLGFPVAAAVLTVFAVAGVSNAINIIDGCNGLASLTSALIFTAIACVAYQVNDALVLMTSLSAIGALLGFFALNFPRGKIFLGDGGAYFIGFMLSVCGILLFHRNPTVSPWFAVLALAYPITETLFSAYRRFAFRKHAATAPDRAHLHHLFLFRVVKRVDAHGHERSAALRNSETSPYLWALCLCSLVPALVFWNQTPALMVATAVNVMLYVWLYQRLTRFKTPALIALVAGHK